MSQNYRVGMIVPSSNTTMETEIPKMLIDRMGVESDTFTFHSARMRMMHVSPEELKKMDADSDRCALELSDARCDVLAYACLIAIMCQGPGYHNISEERLTGLVKENTNDITPIVSSAGALIQGIETLGVKKVSIITPYMKPLTNMVIEYLNTAGIEVIDSISLEVADNLEVGRLDPANLVAHADKLNIEGAEAVVLSACVQMPSLPSIQIVEDRLGIPVLSAATSTVYQILKQLGLKTAAPNAGSLLSGKY